MMDEKIKIALWIVAVVAIGLFAINQAVVFIGYSKAIQAPCDLCATLNPHLKECFWEKSWQTTPAINYSYGLEDN